MRSRLKMRSAGDVQDRRILLPEATYREAARTLHDLIIIIIYVALIGDDYRRREARRRLNREQ